MPGESKTSVNRLAQAERQRQALELRRGGMDFASIARRLGYRSVAGAYEAVMSGLKKTLQEPADDVRKQEQARLDRAQAAIWPMVLAGNLGAVDRLIKILERRARLLGLDAPIKLAPTDPTGEMEYHGRSDADIVRDLCELSEALRARAGGTIAGGGEISLDVDGTD